MPERGEIIHIHNHVRCGEETAEALGRIESFMANSVVALGSIDSALRMISERQEDIMSALSDAVAAAQTASAALLSKVDEAIAAIQSGGTAAADVQAAVDTLGTLSAAESAKTNELAGVLTPPV